MSALGHKQTFAVQKGIARFIPRETCAVQLGMSALCQKRMFASDRVIYRFAGSGDGQGRSNY